MVKNMWSEKRAKRRNDTLNKLAMIKSWRDKAWCGGYVGVACIDGTCPRIKVNQDEYQERCIPVVWNCKECHFYRGCEDCAFFGTKYCEHSTD